MYWHNEWVIRITDERYARGTLFLRVTTLKRARYFTHIRPARAYLARVRKHWPDATLETVTVINLLRCGGYM